MAKFTKGNAPKGGLPLAKGSSKGNPPKGAGASQYKRGFTAQAPGKNPADPPPKLSKGVTNDFRRDTARSAVMPPPAGDTQEPRMSQYTGPRGASPAMKRTPTKGLSKGRPR
jgi:hypothetical protein